MRRLVGVLLGCLGLLYGGISRVDITPPSVGKHFMGIEILDQRMLSYSHLNGMKFSEISDLAYHAKTHHLYLVSDEGRLFTFRAVFGETISTLEPIDAVELKKKNAKPFKRWRRDSEGMTLDGEGRLLISFEGKPKVGWFHKNLSKAGVMIRKYPLPKKLRSPKAYRTKNKSLEALAWHPQYGILTVAEWPLKQDHKKRQTLYALLGREWHFQAEPEARSAVSAIEVMDDGNLLVLERSYTGMMNPFVITLKKVYIQQCYGRGNCPTEIVAKMSSHKGWDVDNFEGLARVGKDRYVMISDDNDNFFQKTLLLYFEVK